MKNYFGRSLTMVWVIIFVVGALFLQFRAVDGTGIIQTTEVRLLTQLLWLALFLIIAMIQLIIWMFIKRK